MARGLDFSSLTRAERTVLGAGLGLFANGFIPWWFRVPTEAGARSFNAGLTNWATIAVGVAAVAVLAVMARAAIWPQPAPGADGLLYIALGVTASAALLVQLTRTDAAWIGLWAGLVLALSIATGGIRRRAERRSGWN